MEQRSEEWFNIRKGRVTGSAVGAILGIAPFAKQADILRRMVRDWHKAPSEFVGNIATQWGTMNEDEIESLIAKLFSDFSALESKQGEGWANT